MPATPAARYRFIPIEANTPLPPSFPPHQQTVLPKSQPPAGAHTLYPNSSSAPPAAVHYNPPGAAHPYFFPPVLAHQPGAHLPTPNPPPSQAPAPPSALPSAPPQADPPNTSFPTPLTPSTPAASSKPATDGTPVTATASDIVARAQTAAAQTPIPDSELGSSTPAVNINPRYPPKGQNSAARPLTHPNPQALGLTRISPPPECHYPTPEVIATVVHAWSTSRGYRLSRQKSDRNAAGQMYKQYYLCTRHGRPTNTHKVTPETRQRKQRKSERIGCPMGLVVRAVDASNPSGDWTVRWQLEGKSEWHNHGPATEEEVAAEKERSERNERRKASRGLGNGKRGRRLKDPNKPARKRDRRKQKPEQEGSDAGGTPVSAGADGINTSAAAATAATESQAGPLQEQHQLQQQSREHHIQQGHAQQLQHELTSSLQPHNLSTLTQTQHPHQQKQQQHQHLQPQHHPRAQHSHTQHHPHPQPQPTQNAPYPTQPLPNLWGLSNANLITHHQQSQQNQQQQQQQQQAYRSFGRDGGGMVYGQPGAGGGGGGQSGMGYR